MALLAGLACLVGTLVAPPAAAVGPMRDEGRATIPIRFHVATVGGEPAKGEPWLREQVERANGVFAPTGLSFRVAGISHLPSGHVVLADRNDRHQLGQYLERGVVNVFVVAEMRDVDHPTQWRRGVHWRLPWRPQHHFLVLTAIAPPTTLAHEMGHFFGNRRHRWVPGNIMSYDHGDSPRFDRDQVHRVRDSARSFLRQRQLYTMPTYARMVREGRLPSYLYPVRARRASRSM